VAAKSRTTDDADKQKRVSAINVQRRNLNSYCYQPAEANDAV